MAEVMEKADEIRKNDEELKKSTEAIENKADIE